MINGRGCPFTGSANSGPLLISWARTMPTHHRYQRSGTRFVPSSARRAFAGLLVPILLGGVVKRAQPVDPWAPFHEKTAWMWIGLWDENIGDWDTLLSHRFREGRKRNRVIPVPGDVVELTHPQSLILLGFRKTGEARNRESPAGMTIEPDDETGIVVPRGTVLKVLDVQRHQRTPSLLSIWARVAPAVAP